MPSAADTCMGANADTTASAIESVQNLSR
jgi:hypothetical protein